MDLAPGALLQDKYLLMSTIGRGGMGEVFAAKRLDDGREVAIKVVSHRVVDDTLMARLEREAIAARRIRSIFVPEVYEIARTDDGELFLVMRLLHGEPLSARLREQRVLPWAEVTRIVDDVLSALTDAHAAGVVHRDLKPGNIFVEHLEAPTLPGASSPAWNPLPAPEERAMILDFGVCKLDVTDGPKLTVTGESVGTVSYMAPEQIRGASNVDGRADLYSLAMVIFEMVCGRIAFDPSGQMAILAAKLEGRAKRLRDHAVVPVPGGLDAFVARALARKPGDRFESARAMQQAWRALGPPTEMPRVELGTRTPSIYPTQSALSAGTHVRSHGGSRVRMAVAGVCLVASAVAITLAVVRQRRVVDETAAVAPLSTSSLAAMPAIELESLSTSPEAPVPPSADLSARSKPPKPRPRLRPVTPSTSAHFTTEPRY